MSDKTLIYKLMTVCNIAVLIGGGLMVYDIVVQDEITWLYWVGFVVSNGCTKGTYMLSISLLAKVCPPELRGTMFSLAGLCGSIAIFLF